MKQNVTKEFSSTCGEQLKDKIAKILASVANPKVSIFVSKLPEISTAPLIDHLYSIGAKVYIPAWNSGEMWMCHVASMEEYQKLVEETPSPFMTPELREAMGDAAVKAALSIGYEGVGTIEFLVDKHRNFYFMEMNTRIQVEHPITEEVTDFDLIKEQIKVAAGEAISGQNYTPKLFAMECRINAEDPANNFRPSPGKITQLHFPGGHGVRIDSHVYAGYTIPPNYDSMIAKVIVSGQSRAEVMTRMKRALQEFVIEGVKTTIPFHIRLMDDPGFQSGIFTTKFLESFDFSNL
jgi:acetyl-CoA carboxylase biotin carboxylase subunit